MRVIIQRVREASVMIGGSVRAQIKRGLLVFVGIEERDAEEDVEWLSKKVVVLRIFADKKGMMNASVQDVAGEVLVVSQFTLHASTKKGNRPSFIKAAKPAAAIPLYESFCQALERHLGKAVYTGEFGADMQIQLLNDGPVTITIDSRNRE